MVFGEVVSNEWLSTVFVYSLKNFVAGCVTQAREEGGELGADRGGGILFEDDGIEGGDGGDLRVLRIWREL